jgi:hypothetical protein
VCASSKQRHVGQALAIQVQQIESVERDRVPGLCASMLERLERRPTIGVNGDDLAVDEGALRLDAPAPATIEGYASARSLLFRERICTASPALTMRAR